MKLYADFNATGKVSAEHLTALSQRILTADGNPSSQHSSGRGAKVAMETARLSVARLLGADPMEIIFTSGATEANNLAIQGKALMARAGGGLRKMVTTAAEHPSVIEPARFWQDRYGGKTVWAPIRNDGILDDGELEKVVDGETDLVALLLANNETGVVMNLDLTVAAIRRKAPACHIHVDAVQAVGRMDVSQLGRGLVDSLAISGHKIGGLKGAGVLYLKSRTKLEPLLGGGSQERNRRPGTENLPAIISFGMRCDDLVKSRPWTGDTLAGYETARKILEEKIGAISGAVIHGQGARRLWNTFNFHVDQVGGDALLMNLDLSGVDASSGSACSTGVGRPSHVLKAMGYMDWEALNSVRLSFGYDFSVQQAEQVGDLIATIVGRLH